MRRIWLVQKCNILGLTQKNVADYCEISRSYYIQIERGLRTPSVSVAKTIAEKLNFEWTIFFKDKCNKKKHKSELVLSGLSMKGGDEIG